MKLDFIKGITPEMLNRPPRKNLIDGFAVTRSINILWAPAGTGKTEFMFGISKLLVEKEQEVCYIDVDNSVDLLQDRGYKKFLENKRFTYVNAEKFDIPREGILAQMDDIRARAVDNFYDNCVFILDSLKFFLNGEMYDEGKIQRLIGFCKSIRRCGGMVFILNHATKKGDTMKGGQGLVDAVDECFSMTVLPETLECWNYIVTPEKIRLGADKVYKTGFALNKKSYELSSVEAEIAEMNMQEHENVQKITAALKDKEMTQGEIMELLGKGKADKTALNFLKLHEGRFWAFKKEGKEKVYTTVTTVQLSTKSA
jgi:RecA-family ATPase